jgi:hypothetical protein
MADARRVKDRAREAMAKHVANTMIMARQNVTAATPVDTGHAMSNWVLSVGSPFRGVDGSRDNVSFSAQASGDAAVRSYTGRDLANGRRIYLRNNVHYMVFLDEGWSPQAVAGFVLKAILAKGATRHMPTGTRRHARAALRRVAMDAIKRR